MSRIVESAVEPARSTRPRTSPILLTGMHRGGSTFAGRILSAPITIGYIPEPFSKRHGLIEIDHWYLYLRKGMVGEDRYVRMLERLLNGHALYKRPEGVEAEVVGLRKLRRATRYLIRSRSQVEYLQTVWNPLVRRYLIKDPLASLASEYLHRSFGMDVVVLVRHPAAFVASIKRATSLHWRPFDFRELLDQRELVEDHLSSLLLGMQVEKLSLIESAALQWTCVAHVLQAYLARNERMILVRHEDLAAQPRERFRELFSMLEIPWDTRVERRVEDLTGSSNPIDPTPGEIHALRRNSAGGIQRWKKHLSSREIDIIRDLTFDVGNRFYGEEDW